MSADEIVHLVLRERQSRDRGWYESYRCLAWYLNRNGYQVGPDHLGDDRPEAVERQYQAEMTWLHESRTPAATVELKGTA
jgi:hypothetical protein